MITQIIKKEWLKIKSFFFLLVVVTIISSLNFWYNLDFEFSTIEPESMMWYKFVHLEQKPYSFLNLILIAFAFAISLAQFLPERIKNRIKILSHLPISMEKSILLHILIGIFYLIILATILGFSTIFILHFYYPFEIINVFIKDFTFYFIASCIVYLILSSCIIEKNTKIAFFKFLILPFFLIVFYQNIFTIKDALWFIVVIFSLLLVIDSFYSIKEQRKTNILFNFFALSSILIFAFFTNNLYKNNYSNTFTKYYIFYSPIIKEFVYQKNFGEHRFEYGIKDKKTFNRKTYESYLPFVYWRNLDIQGKLPVHIDDKSFNKQVIKKSRLSLSFNPNELIKKEVQLYPLINSHKNIGMIRFPEEAISIKKDKIAVYNFDEKLDNKLTNKLKELVKKENIAFPIKNIWGKNTNMKPFDLGHFFIDSNNKLFNLKRRNNLLKLQHIKYDKDNIDIKFMKISENRQKNIAGFMIDKNSNFYLIDYKTFKFKKIKLDDFNYKNMKLQLIANPKYYQIRFNDSSNYFNYVFDKEFKYISKVKLD